MPDWETTKAQLNEKQLEAATHSGSALMVLSGHGTGKSEMIKARVQYLVEELHVSPREIYVITFTREARGSMQARIEETLESEVGRLISENVVTFHKLAYKICLINAEMNATSYASIPNIAEEEYARDLLWESMGVVGYANPEMNKNSVWRMLQTWKMGSRNKGLLPVGFPPVVERYQEALVEAKKWDLSDLIPMAMNILDKNQELAAAFCIGPMIIDEFQDTTMQQYRFVRKLLDAGGGNSQNLVVVGSQAQSIYGFRNADFPQLHYAFISELDADTVVFEINYRSGSAIIAGASALVPSYHKEVNLISTMGKGEITACEIQTEAAEANFLVEAIKTLHERDGVPTKDIAVLIRTWRQRGPIEDAFEREKIPYRISDQSREKFFKTKNVLAMGGYIRAVQAIRDRTSGKNPDLLGSLDLIINTPPRRGIGPVSMGVLLDGKAELGWDQLIKGIVNPSLRPQVRQEVKKLIDLLLELAKDKTLVDPAILMDAVLERTGWHTSIMEELRGKEAFRNIRALQEKSKAFPTIPLFLEHLREKTLIDWDGQGVTLSTIHGAKGLEWRVVFLPGFVDGILPSARSIKSHGDPAEEQRLAHVGFTRARNNLIVSWYRNQRRNDGQGYHPVQPSRFLSRLKGKTQKYDKNNFGFRFIGDDLQRDWSDAGRKEPCDSDDWDAAPSE